MKFVRLNPRLLTSIIFLHSLVAAGGPDVNNVLPERIEKNKVVTVPPAEPKSVAPYAVNAVAEGRNVVYTYSDSTKVRHSGGTRAWRNNNPGNLRDSELVRDAGAVGCAGGFAVFPDYETGRRAIVRLLLSDAYRDMSISSAICKYAPPSENDTEKYKRDIVRMTGISGKRNIADLNPDELERVIDTICVLEGWLEGKRVELAQSQVVAKSRQNTI